MLHRLQEGDIEANCGRRRRRIVRLEYYFETITRAIFLSVDHIGVLSTAVEDVENSINLDYVSVIQFTK